MGRLSIFLLSVAAIVVWMLLRWLAKRGKQAERLPPSELDEANTWYGSAQERAAMREPEDRKRREAEWDALPEGERLERSDQFVAERFGNATIKGLSPAERLKIGRMHFIAD